MRTNSFIYIAFAFILLVVGCKDEDITRISPSGDFAVNFDFPNYEVTAPAKVVLTNRSKYSEEYLWHFPGGNILTSDGLTGEITSTLLTPDTIYYALPGTYSVTLRAWQDGRVDSLSKEIVIAKMQPRIIVPENIGILQQVQFRSEVFKYDEYDVSYSWDFGESGLTSTEQDPAVAFQTEGLHTVTLTINDGVETLTTSVEVVVLGELVKALYFTDAITRRVYRYQFKQLQIPEVTQLPVNTGIHPLNMSVYNNRLYMSDVGVGIAYTSATADGRIFSVDLNGANEIVHTQPAASLTYGDDPFNHTVDESTGTVYFTTRFGGVRSVSANAVEAAYPTVARIALTTAQNDGASVYGWLDGGLQVIDNVLWYTKHGSAGRGLYKFNATTNAFIERPAAFVQLKIRSFRVDTKNQKIYFAINYQSGSYGKGFYRANLDGSNIELIDAMPDFSTQGGDNEQTYVTGIAIDDDPDDGSAGYVYWGYRDNSDVTGNGPTISGNGSNSGIKRYALDGSKPVEFLLKGYAPYGIAIDHVRR